jgi:hypothetical protein
MRSSRVVVAMTPPVKFESAVGGLQEERDEGVADTGY